MKLIPIHELQEGMKLAEDIYGKFDLLYAGRGELLTSKMIDGLKRLGSQSIYIEDEEGAAAEAQHAPDEVPREHSADPLKDYQETISTIYRQYASFKLLNKLMYPKVERPVTELLDFVLSDAEVLRILSKVFMIDGYTLNHCIQVSMISALIGQWLELSPKEQFSLAYAGLLHDVGKSKIPVHILNKPSKLTPEEYDIIKKHAEHSHSQIKGLRNMTEDIRTAVLQHHEKSDGSGYPHRLAGDSVHYYAQIVCIADIYAAMTTDKVYNRKFTPLKAAQEVFNASCSNQVNPQIANLFLQNIYRMLVGSEVRLNNGMIGEIVYFNRFSPARPLVKVKEEFIDLYREKHLFIEEIL